MCGANRSIYITLSIGRKRRRIIQFLENHLKFAPAAIASPALTLSDSPSHDLRFSAVILPPMAYNLAMARLARELACVVTALSRGQMNLPSVPGPLPGLGPRAELLRNSVMLCSGDGTYER